MATAAPPIRQIFLSAVSREFQRTREMLYSDLLGPDMPWRIAEQSSFTVSGMTLLEKLDRYVKESCAVVHIIGLMAGAKAQPQEVASYLASHPQFLEKYPDMRSALGDCKQLSYTQWEAYMALDHAMIPYVFVAEDAFDERPLGFTVSDEDQRSQEAHLQLLVAAGIDRGYFATSERLCSQALRALSRMLQHTGAAEDRSTAEDLETFARLLDAEDTQQGADERSVLAPLHVELALPPHLLATQSVAAEFLLKEPGRTPLERVQVDFEIGAAQASATVDLIPRGQSVRLIPSSQLVLHHEGTSPMQLTVTCERSSIWEKYIWKGVANVTTAEILLNRTGTLTRSQSRLQRIRLELLEEELKPRRGLFEFDLQPVPASGKRFTMGSPPHERGRQADESMHPVRFARSWWMARHPVSQAQYQEVMGNNPSKFNAQSDQLPVENVTWQEAVEFCERLTQREAQQDRLPLGFRYRLPTEAEWEFACRAGDELLTSSGSSKSGTEGHAEAKPMSPFPLDGNRGANRYGLCDMTGNVFQWCLDHYGGYPAELEVDPCFTSTDTQRVMRGGSWHDPLPLRRPAARMRCGMDTRSSRIGFRVVLARI